MPEMRITFLGTSASAPTRDRGLPAVFLEFRGEGFLFDVGEGTQRQFMRCGRSIMKVDHVFISHYHGDHVFGLPGLLSTLALYGRDKPLHVWAPARQLPHVERFLGSLPTGIDYPVHYHGVEEGELVRTESYAVRAYRLDHTAECYAYVFEEAEKVKADKEAVRKLGIEGPLVRELKAGRPVLWNGRVVRPEDVVYRVPGRKVVYAVDTRPVVHGYARGATVLIHDSTFSHSDLCLALERKHSTAREAAELARALGVKRLVLFHFSTRVKDVSVLEREARAVFENSVAAYDGYTLEI